MKGAIYTILIAVMLMASCSHESIPDSATVEDMNSRGVGFTAYSTEPSTKATVVVNDDLKSNGFRVGAYMPNSDQSAAQLYIPYSDVSYDSSTQLWGYVDENGESRDYYWPALASQKLSFVAHYPMGDEAGLIGTDGKTKLFGNERYEADANGDLIFSFGYTVPQDVDNQFDLIYALRENVACPSEKPYSVHLPFCHALTQVGFSAELDQSLDVDIRVHKIVIHNIVYTGEFSVKNDTGNSDASVDYSYNNNGIWWYAKPDAGNEHLYHTNKDGYLISQFGAHVLYDGVAAENNETVTTGTKLPSDGSSVDLTNNSDALMLMPQEIYAWDPLNDRGEEHEVGTYLAISCEITQLLDGEVITIHQKEKWLYAPLATQITYPAGTKGNGGDAAKSNEWVAGYSIIYHLKFGGGYSTVPGKDNPVETLTPMVIVATAKDWVGVDGGELMTEM